ncbi:MAG: HD domain-containing protein [Candidatus Omnitrophica bacterium]|nr:HD domain-containing protein [Candidatus Omnitrophota bacterium]MCM8793971.1 HD domain-containing protein [Candidatus Omnitrophota bacterium]
MEKDKLLQRLLNEPYLLKEKQLFDKLTGENSVWWIKGKDLKKRTIFFPQPSCPYLRKKSCFSQLSKLIKDNRRLNRCAYNFRIFSFPIFLNSEKTASFYLYICHFRKDIPLLAIECLENSLKLILDKIKKEEELKEIYETVKPRAIALSTVHTVHRLIASTLNLDELLPRIARLCLQVLRAKKCIISLVDPVKKTISPKAYIDLDNKDALVQKISPRKLKYERWVLNNAKVYLQKDILCVPLIDQDVVGTIRVENKLTGDSFNHAEREILTVLGEQAVVAIKNAQLYEERGRIIWGSIRSLAALLDIRLPDTYTHPIGFVEIVLEIGKELKLSEEEMEALKYAALLLDAGKISIPDEILMKPSKLTGKEYSLIKEHPIKSAEIVGTIEAMKPAVPLIMHHHERYDGKGYPMGLRKGEIPLGARIISLADAFEAMVCKRPYRGESMSIEEAVREIKKSSGTQFDPLVVKAFLKLVKEERIKNIICRLQERR